MGGQQEIRERRTGFERLGALEGDFELEGVREGRRVIEYRDVGERDIGHRVIGEAVRIGGI